LHFGAGGAAPKPMPTASKGETGSNLPSSSIKDCYFKKFKQIYANVLTPLKFCDKIGAVWQRGQMMLK